ncbi:MAG TPA: hypothetical protein VGF09_06410 [Solirubrobacterales bacterium]
MRHRGIVAGAALVAASLTIGALLTETTFGVVSHLPSIPPPLASGAIAPIKLPRTQPAPINLSIGFESPRVEGSTPEVESIDLELSRHITFETAGLPSCSSSQLYATDTPQEYCPKSLVGRGSVASEIRKPDGTTITLTGHLLAFYSLDGHRSLILARVETGEPLPLVYVIPFTIRNAEGSFGTDLSVSTQAMAGLQGKCATTNPYCFYSPHKLVGIYDRISSFEMSLHRTFRGEGGRASFVSAVCPAPRGFRQVNLPIMDVRLNYLSGPPPLSSVVVRRCIASR